MTNLMPKHIYSPFMYWKGEMYDRIQQRFEIKILSKQSFFLALKKGF